MGKNDFEDRELCPDELCTGIIGENGRCGVCGRPREKGAGEDQTPSVEPGAEEPGAESLPDSEEPAEAQEAEEEKAEEFGPEDRIPCADGLCTGIIGEDGRCGVCGRTPKEAKEDS